MSMEKFPSRNYDCQFSGRAKWDEGGGEGEYGVEM